MADELPLYKSASTLFLGLGIARHMRKVFEVDSRELILRSVP